MCAFLLECGGGEARAVPGALAPPRDSLFPGSLLAPGSFSSISSLSLDFPVVSPKLQGTEGAGIGAHICWETSDKLLPSLSPETSAPTCLSEG